MNCEVLSTLYIRSNGDIACDDDVGEKIILAAFADGNMSLRGFFRNPSFTHIQRSFRDGEAPWPGTCPSCAFFRQQEPFHSSNFHSKIRKVQIEPSLACNLRCPCCSQAQQMAERPKPFIMKAAFFEQILSSIRAEGFRLGEIEYCGQGELSQRKSGGNGSSSSGSIFFSSLTTRTKRSSKRKTWPRS